MSSSSSSHRILSSLLTLQQQIVSSHGGEIHNSIEFIHHVDSGVGIHTNSTLQKGDIAMRIPYSSCLSMEMVLRDPNLNIIFEENPGLLNYPDEVLCIGLMYAVLHEKDDVDNDGIVEEQVCEWSLHTLTLPRSLNTTLFWTEEEVNELKGTNLYHLTVMMKKQVGSDWENIHSPIASSYPDQLGGATIELYTWALGMVYSRAIGIHRHGEYIRCIPPVLDMANHNRQAGTEAADTIFFDESKDEVRLMITRTYHQGDEIHVMYGDYGNAKLAHTYGFVVRNPNHVGVDLWTKITPRTLFGAEKQAFLSASPLTAQQTYDFEGTIRSGGYISTALLTTIRVIQATEDELRSGAINLAFSNQKMISVRNESATYASLRELLLLRMNPEAAEADRIELGRLLLDGAQLSNRKVMALIIRTEERELYVETLQRVDQLTALLQEQGASYVPPDAANGNILPPPPPEAASEA